MREGFLMKNNIYIKSAAVLCVLLLGTAIFTGCSQKNSDKTEDTSSKPAESSVQLSSAESTDNSSHSPDTSKSEAKEVSWNETSKQNSKAEELPTISDESSQVITQSQPIRSSVESISVSSASC